MPRWTRRPRSHCCSLANRRWRANSGSVCSLRWINALRRAISWHPWIWRNQPNTCGHHLALVGRTDSLFADDAIARLHKLSLGFPRALNNAAIAALIAAATAGKALVDDECARKAVAELTRE